MCDAGCAELGAWCGAFTRTERLLTALQAALLAALVAMLALLALHLSVCPRHHYKDVHVSSATTTTESQTTDEFYDETFENETSDEDGVNSVFTDTNRNQIKTTSSEFSSERTFKTKDNIDCTWVPSEKTSPATRYYEDNILATSIEESTERGLEVSLERSTEVEGGIEGSTESGIDEGSTKRGLFLDVPKFSEESDGELAAPAAGGVVLALVRRRGAGAGDTLGCSLTVVAAHWALTAASCLEAVEEVDVLDAFVMVEHWGVGDAGRSHAVVDLRVHPRYRAPQPAWDVAALRAGSPLPGPPAALATPLDAALLTAGETLSLLGYGHFRTEEAGEEDRALREARVVRLPRVACRQEEEGEEPGGDSWALRHLWGGGAAGGEGVEARGVCAGVRWARGAPCHYCGGSPLLLRPPRPPRLLGVMSRAAGCGASCEPTLFVSLPDVAGWLRAVIDT